MDTKTLMEVRDLFGGYPGNPVIKNISFKVNKGEVLGIIGPNGSGKSTLLKIMSRALMPGSGEILLEGRAIKAFQLKEFCRKVAFLGQEPETEFSFSSLEIVSMGRIPHLRRLQEETARDKKAIEEAMLSTFVSELSERDINALSSGERQRVFLARALAQEPSLLLLDEPTSHLDIGHQVQILDLLKDLNSQKNLSIVMVIHDLNLAGEYCDRLILMNEGRVFCEGKPHDVLTYANLESVYKTVVLVDKNPVSRRPYIMLVPKGRLNK